MAGVWKLLSILPGEQLTRRQAFSQSFYTLYNHSWMTWASRSFDIWHMSSQPVFKSTTLIYITLLNTVSVLKCCISYTQILTQPITFSFSLHPVVSFLCTYTAMHCKAPVPVLKLTALDFKSLGTLMHPPLIYFSCFPWPEGLRHNPPHKAILWHTEYAGITSWGVKRVAAVCKHECVWWWWWWRIPSKQCAKIFSTSFVQTSFSDLSLSSSPLSGVSPVLAGWLLAFLRHVFPSSYLYNTSQQ